MKIAAGKLFVWKPRKGNCPFLFFTQVLYLPWACQASSGLCPSWAAWAARKPPSHSTRCPRVDVHTVSSLIFRTWGIIIVFYSSAFSFHALKRTNWNVPFVRKVLKYYLPYFITCWYDEDVSCTFHKFSIIREKTGKGILGLIRF